MELPCDFDTALELWTAWRDGHVLPHGGGLLDQPRWWRSLVRFMNSRHAPIYAAYQREQPNGKPQRAGEYDGDMLVADGFAALNGYG